MKTEFTKNGFHHEQIKRDGDVALFAMTKNGSTHFEVIRVVTHGEYTIAGVTFPAGESYPSSEQWGSRGWTYRDRGCAEVRFAALV